MEQPGTGPTCRSATKERRMRADTLWNELVDGMEYHSAGPQGDDAVENFLADPGWVEDLEEYCFLTGQKEEYVLPELRGAALARLEDRERV